MLDKTILDSVKNHLELREEVYSHSRHIFIVDFTQPSFVRRGHLVDLENDTSLNFFVTHGKNSGGAWVESVSNTPESYQSSRGFFKTGQEYNGRHGRSLKLHGLEKGINDNAFKRNIVIHGSEYARWESILLNKGRLGRSLGCLALPPDILDTLIDSLGSGALVYVHFNGD